MARRIRFPFLIDLIQVEAPAAIRDLADNPCLDRRFEPRGPLLNRVIARCVRRVLQVRGERLPSALPRDDASRAAAQSALEQRLDPAASPPPWDTDSLDALARYVCGDNSRPVGQLAQEAVGRLFKPGYRATAGTWRDAVVLDAATRSLNPIRRLYWLLSFRIERAQGRLSDAVGGDLAAVHATGIALHNLVESIERLRALYADAFRRAGHTHAAVLAHALVAPRAVLRQASSSGDTLSGSFAPGTLVSFATRPALARSLDPRIGFATGSWSLCPAHRLVPALLLEVWSRALQPAPKGSDP